MSEGHQNPIGGKTHDSLFGKTLSEPALYIYGALIYIAQSIEQRL